MSVLIKIEEFAVWFSAGAISVALAFTLLLPTVSDMKNLTLPMILFIGSIPPLLISLFWSRGSDTKDNVTRVQTILTSVVGNLLVVMGFLLFLVAIDPDFLLALIASIIFTVFILVVAKI